MKHRLIDMALMGWATSLGALRKLHLLPQVAKSAVFLPPATPGSIGDEAMLDGATDALRDEGVEKFIFLTYGADLTPASPAAAKPYSRRVSIMGTLRRAYFVWLAATHERFYVFGADVLDGHYSEQRSLLRLNCARQAERAGARTSILGFSFNDSPTPRVVRTFRSLPSSVRICARDPISHERLKKVLTPRQTLALVADLAFLLRPYDLKQTQPALDRWIDAEQSAGRLLIGVNANQMHASAAPDKKEETLAALYAGALEKICREANTSLVMIPHDRRVNKNGASDGSMSRLIVDRLPSDLRARVQILPDTTAAADIKAVCGRLSFVLTGRMHLAIASLGIETPAICLSYQGKFEGLFRHLGLSGMSMDPIAAYKDTAFYEFVSAHLKNRATIQAQIRQNIPHVRSLALQNFKSK